MACEVGAEIPNGIMMENFGEKNQRIGTKQRDSSQGSKTEQVRVGGLIMMLVIIVHYVNNHSMQLLC